MFNSEAIKICESQDQKIFKEEKSIKTLGLINDIEQ